jgi:hypothetical protein
VTPAPTVALVRIRAGVNGTYWFGAGSTAAAALPAAGPPGAGRAVGTCR